MPYMRIFKMLEIKATIWLKMIEIKIRKLTEDAIIPKYAHYGDAGFDLYSIGKYTIGPKEKAVVKTGLQIEIPDLNDPVIIKRIEEVLNK